MKCILILGGSGFVGRRLCRALAASDVQLTVPTRKIPDPRPEAGHRLRWVQADVMQSHELQALLPGQDTVINLVAILHGNASHFDQVHVDWVQRLAQLCSKQGVQHLIHVSALGADTQGPSMYQRSKGQGEKALQRLQADTGLNVSILRPSVIFGQDDQFLNTFARLQRFAPFVPLTGADTRFQPVWVDDVAQALASLALSGSSPAPVLEACGPEVFTLAELVRHAGQWAGCERSVLPLPAALGKLQAWVMEHLPGKTLMSRDNVDSLRVDNVASGVLPGLSMLGISASPLNRVFPVPRSSASHHQGTT